MRIVKKATLLLAAIALAISLAACGGEGGRAEDDGRPLAAVSIVPQETFVKKVCGDLARVVVMIPPGYSPESYEPTPKDMTAFSDADIYFSIGVPAEEAAILPSLPEGVRLVSLNEAAALEYPELMIDGGRDPHIWLSVKRAEAMVNAIAGEMSGLDPKNAETYEANANAYIQELRRADKEISEALSGLKDRGFIVFHPAFGYFADDYGLEMIALEEGGKEATASRMKELADLARQRGIKVIFHQAEVDSRQSDAFAEEIGGRAVMLDPLSGDYIENLIEMAAAIGEGSG